MAFLSEATPDEEKALANAAKRDKSKGSDPNGTAVRFVCDLRSVKALVSRE
jgi:hypothetical protein